SDPSFDWQESRRWCGDVLRRLTRWWEKNPDLISLLGRADHNVGGDEHHIIRVEAFPDRVFKLTHGDNFGCRSYFSPHDPELTGRHFHGTGNADPFFYLRRWRLLNLIGGYQTRFEGFVPAEKPGWLPRICVSQPALEGTNPPRSDIRKAMLPYGYREISEDAFLDFDSGVLLTDLAPRNVRIVEGIPAPFDAIAQLASPAVLAWARGRLG
ncbi:MAG TPA: hypothetical protein VGO11_02630, partial [Chthoniobacteraceae bacterium]|nr:hypothetical protein [Chthoniobacteraceae bacterium]